MEPRPRRDLKILTLLAKMAEDVVPVSRSRHAAAVVLDGTIVSFGVNQNKTHPFQAKYSHHPEARMIHAENSALLKALKRLPREDLKRADLYVSRIKTPVGTSELTWGNSCPCLGCQRAIREFGLRRVIHTLEGRDFAIL